MRNYIRAQNGPALGFSRSNPGHEIRLFELKFAQDLSQTRQLQLDWFAVRVIIDDSGFREKWERNMQCGISLRIVGRDSGEIVSRYFG